MSKIARKYIVAAIVAAVAVGLTYIGALGDWPAVGLIALSVGTAIGLHGLEHFHAGADGIDLEMDDEECGD